MVRRNSFVTIGGSRPGPFCRRVILWALRPLPCKEGPWKQEGLGRSCIMAHRLTSVVFVVFGLAAGLLIHTAAIAGPTPVYRTTCSLVRVPISGCGRSVLTTRCTTQCYMTGFRDPSIPDISCDQFSSWGAGFRPARDLEVMMHPYRDGSGLVAVELPNTGAPAILETPLELPLLPEWLIRIKPPDRHR